MISSMFLSLKELVRWFGMTAFEIWTHLITILVFSVLLVLKLELAVNWSWWTTFSPLFVADGLNTYFTAIVFIRQIRPPADYTFRTAGGRLLSSMLILSLLFVFKFLLCQKLSDPFSKYSHSEVIAPLFPLMVLLTTRACQPRS